MSTWAGPSDEVTTTARRATLVAQGAWTSETLPELVASHAADDGQRTAVIDRGGARLSTYAELDRDANRVANLLIRLGVRPGNVVSVQLPNAYETVAVDVGVLRAGAVLNPMLPIYRAKELRHMLTVGRVPVIFSPGVYRGFDHQAMIAPLRAELPSLREHLLVVDDDGWESLLDGVDDAPPHVSRPAEMVSELIFTSGTEALPKAVMHTEQTTCFGARALARTLGLGQSDVVWTPSPIGHSTGLNYGVRIALALGLPMVLQDRWDPAAAVRLIERFRCTYTVATTTFVSDVCEAAAAANVDVSSMQLFGSGGAPIPPAVVEAAERLGMCVLRMYGSTEVLAATWNRPASPREKRLQTDGPAIEGMEIEVRDEHGRRLDGEPGEIFIRGGSTSVGFFDDPERTGETYRDGWVRSGDLGILDADGFLSIVGRRKEIIIRGGLNIAPREIEELILDHPAVAEVAVVGLPDSRLGEITCACIVVAASVEPPGLDELVDFLRDRGLATFKLPQRLSVLDALPKTPTGKVQKGVLVTSLTEHTVEI
jgi:acyl-coenzyme A synthetase/AMP-(fatty) acid ligase